MSNNRPSFESVALFERACDALADPPLLDDPLSSRRFRDYLDRECARVDLGILPRRLEAGASAAKSA